MTPPPTGTLTFLFTDIAGSTRLWDTQHQAMKAAHATQADLIAEAVATHHGHLVRNRGEGDSTFSVFPNPAAALATATTFQRALFAETWPTDTPLRVRAALHVGPAELREGDYNSTAVNRCARLRSLASGGQTLVSGAVAAMVESLLPEGVSLRSLGSHRLKDLERAEEVYQLCHVDLPADFPALRSLEVLPTNLPQQLNRFIGREQEIARIVSLLRTRDLTASEPTTRLLTLTGTGGAGKTRLSLQVGAELLDAYSDGVWFVELAALTQSALIPATLAQALNLREEPGRPLFQTLSDFLHPRTLLLILDNCEHLVADCARIAESLLRTCPHLKILATSREPLNIAGETIRRIPSLSLPQVSESISRESLLNSEAVQLFLDRARSVNPGFQATEANAPAIAQIIRRLDGIPLALELAAARVKVLSPDQIAARLDQQFRLLTGGSRTALPRQQTLRALIDWSYELLPEQERTLLARLSVFSGGWTLEAAEAVCTDTEGGIENWEVLDLLSSLVDKSLAVAEEQSGTVRYQMLQTIRQYGAEKLDARREEAEIRRKHRDWYLELVQKSVTGLMGGEQARWLEGLETEHGNLRRALDYCLETPGEAQAGLRLAGTLQRFWAMRGHLFEGREYLTALLALPEALEPNAARARALNGAGMLAYRQGDYTEARTLHEAALEIERALGNARGIVSAFGNLGNLALEQGDYTLARSLYAECLTIARELGEKPVIAGSLSNMGLTARLQCDYTLARSLYEESLVIDREMGDKEGISTSLNNLANVIHYQGDYAAACALHEESLTLRRELGDRSGISSSLNNLGNIAREQGEFARARLLHEEALALRRELGDRSGIALSLNNLGGIAQAEGDVAAADTLFRESLTLWKELGDRAGLAMTLNNLGYLSLNRGDYAATLSLNAESLAIRQELGDKRGVAESLEACAALALHLQKPERAVRLNSAAARLRNEIGAPLATDDRVENDRRIAEMRRMLNETAFSAAWSEGQTLSWEQAVALALEETTA